jgi:hypothetical protein
VRAQKVVPVGGGNGRHQDFCRATPAAGKEKLARAPRPTGWGRGERFVHSVDFSILYLWHSCQDENWARAKVFIDPQMAQIFADAVDRLRDET